MAFLLVGLTGCDDFTKEFGQGVLNYPGNVVKTIFNIDDYDKKEQTEQNNKLALLAQKISLLEQQSALLYDLLLNLDMEREEDYVRLTDTLNNVNLSFDSDLALIKGQLDALEAITQYSIVGIYDPCGDQIGHDEILLELNTGDLIGYFEQGNKRFLTKLDQGTYMTTDGSSCYFTVE